VNSSYSPFPSDKENVTSEETFEEIEWLIKEVIKNYPKLFESWNSEVETKKIHENYEKWEWAHLKKYVDILRNYLNNLTWWDDKKKPLKDLVEKLEKLTNDKSVSDGVSDRVGKTLD